MNWEKLWTQALSVAAEAAKTPVGARVKTQLEKGMITVSPGH
jgi:hypothetical protein